MLKIGVANEETWGFFHEVQEELESHHQLEIFKPRRIDIPLLQARVNQFLFRRDLHSFMTRNDIVFFEWSSRLLHTASQMPKTCAIVTRLHRYELYKWADQITWNVVDKVIVVSRAKKTEFIERFPEQQQKVVVIPVGVDLARFQGQEKPFQGNLGILCHLRPRKRVYDLILTFYELVQKRPDLHLHIGGGEAPGFGEYYEAIHQLVHKLQLEDRVTFYDHVEEPEAWYRNVDIFISNSYSEGLQVSPLEAIASGCYCLSHHWDGADELLPVDDLYFTDSELQNRILDYCQLKEEERLRRRTRQREIVCQHFDVGQTKVQVRELIESVAATL